ncbi:MAG: threonylcarbamoyl-AMP synthase [Fimbriimonas ginsengisoli]|uniref:Threonylcarbamoyl-AMP synthase n=1 Tax=Fimbriimonas ginsengisoli TaxID=1005039 RepID=A0A931PTA2_FIMGI|nr:threonylcarbamoyl-AMP synthase [Fimbriimonas ginsengisoli]
MNIVAPTPEAIREAADALRRGELVGMPTETVYGLAADACNPTAVRRAFEAKGRPAENPMIVHLASSADLARACGLVPPIAKELAVRFWPGPLTLVLPKGPAIAPEVPAGRETVAVRVPDHSVALALLRESGLMLAAPSANRFGELSPTRADMIEPSVAVHLALVLDGGPCRVGIESTVLDLTVSPPAILRPGGVSRAELEALLGPLGGPDHERRSPGLYPRHYAPRARLRLVKRLGHDQPGLSLGEAAGPHQIAMPLEPEAYAARLYAGLRELDCSGAIDVFVQEPPKTLPWEAVWDRLQRASGLPEVS